MPNLAKWFEKIVPDAHAALRRFPLAALLVATFTFVILAENKFANLSNEMMMRLLGGIVLAAYVSVNLVLYAEGRGKPILMIVHIGAVCLSLLFGYFFRQLAFITPAAIGASILFLGNAPFLREKHNDVAVWDFTHKLWTAVLFTVAGSVIYVIGIIAITAALKSLFGLNIKDAVEDWLFPIGLGFLAPMAWLSMLPRHDADDEDSLRNLGFISKALGFLGTWILAPLTLIYAVILLAYGIKTVMTQSVPNGEFAQLVTPFLIIGTLTWLILDPPFIQKKRLALIYTKLWFPLSIPAALLLTYAVFARINQYGWTIERYLLVLASVWALGIAVWFIVKSEAKRDIRIIPGFAALLLALASIGPWGADAVSSFSQARRLQSALVANQMLNEQGVLKPVSEIDMIDKAQAIKAKGALKYLVEHKKSGKILKFVPTEEREGLLEKRDDVLENISNQEYLANINVMERFKLDKVQIPSRYKNIDNNQFTFNYDNYDVKPIFVTGYDYISKMQSFNYFGQNSGKGEIFEETYSIGNYNIQTKGENIHVTNKFGDEIAKVDIVNWLKGQPVNQSENSIDINAPIVLLDAHDVKIVLHIDYARYSENSESMTVQYIILAKGGLGQ